ncbi:MAG: MerR family transcriptional regulator [Acidobacteriia bacterium]|nr:MerR family transcriptional regulator [Terriglobia bacterium]
MQFTTSKLYYRIGEVCDIVGVEAHVLRYWETEFPSLAPPKNKAGQRTYRPKDVELLLTIRRLLYDEGFTIAGARRQLARGTRDAAALGQPRREIVAKPSKPAPAAPAQRLNQVREELENILTLLDRE